MNRVVPALLVVPVVAVTGCGSQDAPAGSSGTSVVPSAAPSTPTAALRGHSLAQVARHATAGDCWAVVDGKVYDLTSWIANHPGGPEQITGMCGTDSSKDFDGKHGNDDEAKAQLAQLQVGTLTR